MSNYEFLSYEPDPERKILGVITIRAWGKIILKYKAIMRKDASSWFIKPAGAVKNGYGPDGKDHYDDAFMIDSNYEIGLIDKEIRAHVNPLAEFSESLENEQKQAPTMQHIHSRPNTPPAPDRSAWPSPISGVTPNNAPNYGGSNKSDDVPF